MANARSANSIASSLEHTYLSQHQVQWLFYHCTRFFMETFNWKRLASSCCSDLVDACKPNRSVNEKMLWAKGKLLVEQQLQHFEWNCLNQRISITNEWISRSIPSICRRNRRKIAAWVCCWNLEERVLFDNRFDRSVFVRTQNFGVNPFFGIAPVLKRIRKMRKMIVVSRSALRTIRAGHQGKLPSLHQTISPGSYRSAFPSTDSTVRKGFGLVFSGLCLALLDSESFCSAAGLSNTNWGSCFERRWRLRVGDSERNETVVRESSGAGPLPDEDGSLVIGFTSYRAINPRWTITSGYGGWIYRQMKRKRASRCF